MRRAHVTLLGLIGLAIGGVLTNGLPRGVRAPSIASPRPTAETTRSMPPPERLSRSTPRQTLADLDAGTRHGIFDAMRVAQHVAGTTTLSFTNPEQQVQAAIGPTSAIVTGRDGARVEFTTPTLARADTSFPLSAAAPTGGGTSHIEIARTAGDVAVTEWWNNTASGLEQGFTVHARPGGDGPLEIQQTLQSALGARLSADGSGLVLADDSGARLQFDNLRAWDRDGRDLPARLELRGATLAMVVDDTRARYPVTIDPTWTQQAYLKASNTGGIGDAFGYSVAVSDDTAVVGAYGEASNATGVNGNQTDDSAYTAGAAYVFVRSGTTWTQQAYLKASNPNSFDLFGHAVAVSGDTVVVAAPGEDSNATGVNGDQANNSTAGAGAVYVFGRTGTTWTQQAYLKASNTGAGDDFGWSVAVAGETLVVGALSEDSHATGVNGDQADNSATYAGAAYVFVRSGTTWTQQAYLKASNTGSNDRFGWSVGMSGDTVVVGASWEESAAAGVNGNQADNSAVQAGAAYVFVRTGTAWTQQAYLKASNTGAGDSFGWSVAVSGDTVVVGAHGESSAATGVNGNQADNSASGAGAAYVFVRTGTTWTQQAYLKASNTGVADRFGSVVAVSGGAVVVGAWQEDSNATGVNGNQANNSAVLAGAAYVFDLVPGAAPGAFSKSSPAHGATSQSTSAMLSWGASTGATSYEYCIDATPDTACSGWTSVGASTSVGLTSLAPSTAYSWQVRANNTSGTTYANGSPTTSWSFTTQSATDTDLDGLPDAWESQFGLDPASSLASNGANGDPDGDGRTNLQELQDGTHPRGFVTRYLAEGATSAFFSTRIALLNPTNTDDVVNLRFLRAVGGPVSTVVPLPARGRRTVDVKTLPGLADAAFATVLESVSTVVADRTMTWDATRYGSHAETSVPSPETTWYLAEGATHSGFDLFYLVQNPNDGPAQLRVEYLLPHGGPLEKTYTVPANSRFNIWVDVEQFPEGSGVTSLANTDVSAVFTVTNGAPVIVERAMYLSRPGRPFSAGHEGAGVTAPSTRWFLAEGATGPFFDLFVLLANPGDQSADVRVRYLLGDGSTYSKTMSIAPKSRANIWVDYETPDGTTGFPLADVAVSTTVESTNGVPILVERAMWWPGDGNTWHEAHNSAGSTETGLAWGLADGEVGGTSSLETYILIANTSSSAGRALVTLLFEDGTEVSKEFALAATSRTNVAVASEFPAASGKRFGAIVESVGTDPGQIVVERAMYSNAQGVVWAAGTNALATRLK